jgi:hypothetical protein
MNNQNNLRISVTTLDSYRRYVQEQDEEMSENMLGELIASIKGDFTPTSQMLRGQAFHAVLERPHQCYIEQGDTFYANGFYFAGDGIREALNVIDHAGIFELKTTNRYDTALGAVTVVGKADILLGNTVFENKTRWLQTNGNVFKGISAYDENEMYERYQASLQWRFYLELFGADYVQYNVFYLSEHLNRIPLHATQQFTFERTAETPYECYDWVQEFVAFVERMHLQQFFIISTKQLIP